MLLVFAAGVTAESLVLGVLLVVGNRKKLLERKFYDLHFAPDSLM